MGQPLLRWPDIVVIALSFVVLIVIGAICARRSKSADAYFMAGRKMRGWVVGFSMMATIISSMTFLAAPGFTFKHDWRYVPSNFVYLIAMFAALFLFMPFYRRGHVRSAYEYLERRFATWARLYAGACFVFFMMFRMGIILYVVCLPIQTMTGIDLPWILVFFGVVVASYTIAGGLEAVIWTDVLQGIALMVGGLICLPVLVSGLPGGFGQIFSVGAAEGKMSIGNTSLDMTECTLVVVLLSSLVHNLQIMGTEQMSVQRYCAPRTRKEARKAIWLGCLMTIPVWLYFSFIGTALFVFYKVQPDAAVSTMVPERVLPYFILTQVPAGLAGFVIAGLLSAAMSTLDSSINAAAATVTTDYYRRLLVKDRGEQHYARVGRLVSVAFGVIMIAIALTIHFMRSQTMVDLQRTVIVIVGGGLLSLFLLGFLTTRANSRGALVATIVTACGVAVWLFLDSAVGKRLFPGVTMPHKFWINVFSNSSMFVLGYVLSRLLGAKREKDLTDLTVWTSQSGGGEE